jgi:hypothetical protein
LIKLTYEEKQYEYPNVGAQPFDIKAVLELKQDATVDEALAMYLHFLTTIAGYTCLTKEKVIEAVNEYFDYDYYR